MTTTVSGTYKLCQNTFAVELACTGTDCGILDGYPGVSCVGQGSGSVVCTPNIPCAGDPITSTEFQFTYQGISIQSSQTVELPELCQILTITSDASTSGTSITTENIPD